MIRPTHHSAESEDSGRPPPCRWPLQIRAENASFPDLNFSTLFVMQSLQICEHMFQNGPSLGPQICENRRKSPSRKLHEKHIQKVSKHRVKTEARHLPKQAVRLKRLHFLSFATSAKDSKRPQRHPEMTLKSSKLRPEASQKRCQK